MIKEQIKLDTKIEKCKRKFIKLEENKLKDTTKEIYLEKFGEEVFKFNICQVKDF